MAIAVNAQTSVAYIKEVTLNTTPATPAMKRFRATGETLKVERGRVTASELNGGRGPNTSVIATAGGSGGFTFDFTDETLEDFLENALRTTWATDVLTDGNTAAGLTLETRFENGTTDLFKRFTGAQVNQLSFEVAPGQKMTGSVDFMSMGASFANAIVTGATYVAANSEVPVVGHNVSNIAMAGLTLDCVTKIAVNINNNLREQRCLNGSLFPVGLGAGQMLVTGTIGLFLDSTEFDVVTAFMNGTETSLDFRAGPATTKITRFEMPRIVLGEANVVSQSAEGDAVLEVPFTALQASAINGSVIRVTRNVV